MLADRAKPPMHDLWGYVLYKGGQAWVVNGTVGPSRQEAKPRRLVISRWTILIHESRFLQVLLDSLEFEGAGFSAKPVF